MIEAFLSSIGIIILGIIGLYKWIIIIASILSWVNPDPYNPIVQTLYKLTQPAYQFVRKFIPTNFNNFDFAPMVILFVLIFLETFLSRLFLGL